MCSKLGCGDLTASVCGTCQADMQGVKSPDRLQRHDVHGVSGCILTLVGLPHRAFTYALWVTVAAALSRSWVLCLHPISSGFRTWRHSATWIQYIGGKALDAG